MLAAVLYAQKPTSTTSSNVSNIVKFVSDALWRHSQIDHEISIDDMYTLSFLGSCSFECSPDSPSSYIIYNCASVVLHTGK